MSLAAAGLAFVAIIAAGHALSPNEAADTGKRVELESFTAPADAARCIAYNIGRKRPDLAVRAPAGEGAEGIRYLILTNLESPASMYGVIRIEQSDEGSHLTTWLPGKSLASAAPADIASRLVAGC